MKNIMSGDFIKKLWGNKNLFMLSVITMCAIVIINACGDTSSKTKMKEMTNITPEERGKYIVAIGGCNDCHTPGYMEVGGNMDESEWLTGSPMGFRGPWGTSYASNLRLTVQNLSEDAFVQMVKSRNTLPPMPWPSLHKMEETDIRNVYKFIKKLGPKGESAPVAVAPGVEPVTPYIVFVPEHMERLARK